LSAIICNPFVSLYLWKFINSINNYRGKKQKGSIFNYTVNQRVYANMHSSIKIDFRAAALCLCMPDGICSNEILPRIKIYIIHYGNTNTEKLARTLPINSSQIHSTLPMIKSEMCAKKLSPSALSYFVI